MQLSLGATIISLLPERALFLPEDGILVIADLHLGKVTHFRKSGISLPVASALKDYEVLESLLARYNPEQVWFLGDLFHSAHNTEWLYFEQFVRKHTGIRFTLIKGNHDILKQEYYDLLHMNIVPEQLVWGELIFSHAPLDEVPEGAFNIAGHIHPGCLLQGRGRQSLRLPCFYFYGQLLLLPAFGTLTGLYTMAQLKGASVFAVLPERVVLL